MWLAMAMVLVLAGCGAPHYVRAPGPSLNKVTFLNAQAPWGESYYMEVPDDAGCLNDWRWVSHKENRLPSKEHVTYIPDDRDIFVTTHLRAGGYSCSVPFKFTSEPGREYVVVPRVEMKMGGGCSVGVLEVRPGQAPVPVKTRPVEKREKWC